MSFSTLQPFPSLESALAAIFGGGVTVARSRRISGGDINEAYGLTLTDGTTVFVKANTKKNAPLFAAEAAGLAAIACTGEIGTPQVLGCGVEGDKVFLLLSFVVGGKQASDYWETFAHQLAAMHRANTAEFTPGGVYGFCGDNFIGARPQANTAHESWISFFRDCRLEPQFRSAESYFDRGDRKKTGRLLDRLGDFLVEPERPSLLHGDLWSGNFLTGNDGRAWLIDPASYVGHAEADIAMTELFGGFSRTFYDAYKETGLLQPGYGRRRNLYNLYHLLNHLNMFGGSYLFSVKRIIGEYV